MVFWEAPILCKIFMSLVLSMMSIDKLPKIPNEAMIKMNTNMSEVNHFSDFMVLLIRSCCWYLFFT